MMKNLKLQFHSLFERKFCKDYQSYIFEQAFLKKFKDEEPITAGESITYQMKMPVDKDMYQWIIKFCRAYDCNFFTDGGEIHFMPVFSEVKKTYWERLAS